MVWFEWPGHGRRRGKKKTPHGSEGLVHPYWSRQADTGLPFSSHLLQQTAWQRKHSFIQSHLPTDGLTSLLPFVRLCFFPSLATSCWFAKYKTKRSNKKKELNSSLRVRRHRQSNPLKQILNKTGSQMVYQPNIAWVNLNYRFFHRIFWQTTTNLFRQSIPPATFNRPSFPPFIPPCPMPFEFGLRHYSPFDRFAFRLTDIASWQLNW